MKYKAKLDLSFEMENFENISIELKIDGKMIIVSSIYRPPNTNQKGFVSNIRSFYDVVAKTKGVEWIVGLDHNMDNPIPDCSWSTYWKSNCTPQLPDLPELQKAVPPSLIALYSVGQWNSSVGNTSDLVMHR